MVLIPHISLNYVEGSLTYLSRLFRSAIPNLLDGIIKIGPWMSVDVDGNNYSKAIPSC